MVDADRDQIEAALLALHQAGHRQVFIKTRHKGIAQLFTLPEEPVNLWWSISFGTPLEWFLVEHEGARDVLFIQEAFEPTNEYRTIIVGDCAVTGAGCVEAFTPLQNSGDQFDDRVEPVRNRSAEVRDTASSTRYRQFATSFAREWAAAHGDDMIYGLDLAIDARTNDVVAIELNPMANLGLYACNPERIINAVVERFV